MAKEPLLSSEEVASVLSTEEQNDTDAGKTPDGSAEERGSTVYSLRKPVAIAPECETSARQRLEMFANCVETVLQKDLEAEIGIEIQGFQQEQAATAVGSLPQPAWVLSFPHSEGGGISLALDPTCALSLVELALGGAGNTAASGRAPTPLEQRVLTNLCGALSGPLSKISKTSFDSGMFSTPGFPAVVAAPGQTVGIGLLKIKIAETDRNGLIMGTAGLLRDPGKPRGDEALHIGALHRQLERVQVEARPVLRAGSVSLSDLAKLEPGAVLGLEAPEDQSLELRVEGNGLFRGHVSRGEDGPAFEVNWRRGRHVREES